MPPYYYHRYYSPFAALGGIFIFLGFCWLFDPFYFYYDPFFYYWYPFYGFWWVWFIPGGVLLAIFLLVLPIRRGYLVKIGKLDVKKPKHVKFKF